MGKQKTGRLLLTALVVGVPAFAVAGAGTQAEPLLVVAQRVDVKWSATGRLLGWLGSGARVTRLAERDGWSRVQLRGWLPASSVDPAAAGRYAVRPFEEPLRASAGGRTIGGLRRGTQVTVARRAAEWIEIEIIGWLPDASVAPPPEGGAEDAAPEPALPVVDAGPGQPAAGVGILARAVELKEAPAGANLATLAEGTVVAPLETRSGWTRVAIQGWVPSAAVRAAGSEDVRPEIVAAADADAFVGRRATWTVEHVALQRADRLRRDFREGELYALARVPGPAGAGPYVYLAVPDGLADRFRRLQPFATVRVVGTVRTGRSALTGNPILDVEQILP